jgi:polyhydroxyalkanoate synthesis regulator phasin
MRDVVRSYLQIAGGLTEMTRQRVTEVAKALVERSGIDLEQVPDQAQALPQYVQQVAEELYETGRANRDLLVGVVRGEVDKALSRTKPWAKDLAKAEAEITRLKGRVTDLEHRLARASTPRVPRTQSVPVVAEDAPAPVAGPVARKAPAKKGTARPGAAGKTVPAKKTTAAAKKTTAAAGKTAPAKKATRAPKPSTGADGS